MRRAREPQRSTRGIANNINSLYGIYLGCANVHELQLGAIS